MRSNSMIYSPMDGEIISTDQVKDDVFRYEFFGKGITLYPKSNKILSPLAGIIESISKEKHSVIIKAESGARIWIYIGDDIVQLNGKYIKQLVEDKSKVDVGTILLDCDFYEMEKCGYNIEVTVTVMEQEDIFEVIKFQEGKVKKKEQIAGVLFHHSHLESGNTQIEEIARDNISA